MVKEKDVFRNLYLGEWYRKNHSKSKFKIGDLVTFKNNSHKILGMNYVEDDDEGNPIFEYAISNYEWLVWDHELTLSKSD